MIGSYTEDRTDPFWDDTTHQWTPAGRLKPGDALNTDKNTHATVLALHLTPGAANRWNLTVDRLHTYYVLAGATPVLVHNTDCSRATKLAGRVIDKARGGKRVLTPVYHGRLSPDLETSIMSDPDSVYVSTGTGGRFIFRRGGNVVITEGVGPSAGKLVTSYGPDGARGESGAAIFGGSPSDPGMPVTHDMLINGEVPVPGGGTLPPAIELFPDILSEEP